MPKAVGWMALAYVGYLVLWFVLLVVGALVFGQGSLASAGRGVAIVLLGTLLLAAGSGQRPSPSHSPARMSRRSSCPPDPGSGSATWSSSAWA